MTSVVALIPARAGSKRVPRKNTRPLGGHPLFAWAIATAREAGIFDGIIVSSDDEAVARLAGGTYGAHVVARPPALATDYSPDIAWVVHALDTLRAHGRSFDAFAILRPTSPFRRGEWVRRAWDHLQSYSQADSLRAMRPVREHPAKMWRRVGSVVVTPLLPFRSQDAPWHSLPTQELPEVFVQTAALEIAWTFVLPESISGDVVLPWLCEVDAPESLDINTEADWARAEQLAAAHPEWLPPVPAAVAA